MDAEQMQWPNVMSLQEHLLHVGPASDPTNSVSQDSSRQTSLQVPLTAREWPIRAVGVGISLLGPEVPKDAQSQGQMVGITPARATLACETG